MYHRCMFWVYQDSQSAAFAPKGNRKFEMLVVKIFRLK